MALWGSLVLLLLVFLYLVRGILPPFIVSFLIAALLEPSIRRLRLRGYSRFLSVLVVFLAFFGTGTGIVIWLAPKVVSQVQNVSDSVRTFADQLSRENEDANFFVRWNPRVQAEAITNPDQVDVILTKYKSSLQRMGLPTDKRAFIEQYIEPRRSQISGFFQKVFDSVLGILGGLATQLVNILLIPILTFMLLMDMENFKRRAPKWIPPSLRAGTLNIFSDIYAVFIRYLRGISIVLALYIVCACILLSVLNVPYAIVLGILFGALYLIPYIGNVIALFTAFLVVGLKGVDGTLGIHMSSPWAYGLTVALIYMGMGLIFDHLIYPQMVGNSVGLNGIVSMFVILCGGALFGIVGMLMAFPVAGSGKVILDRLLRITSKSPDGLGLPPVPMRHRASSA
jgi:predicted PurR-regulated permease PerM